MALQAAVCLRQTTRRQFVSAYAGADGCHANVRSPGETIAI
jgi:hypothetical protein